MKQSFYQTRVSYTLEKIFGENFRTLWNLVEYHDPNLPAIFFGLYREEDIDVFLNHKSDCILLLGGGEIIKNEFRIIEVLKLRPKNTILIGYGWLAEFFKKNNFDYFDKVVKIKDFSIFKPCELGDKIYYYTGFAGNRKEQLGYNKLILPLIKIYGEEKFITSQYESIENLYENVYKKCFLYIKPIPNAGSTTMFEFANMGIKTVSKNQGNLPNVIEYNTVEDVIKIIESESLKIGTIQKDLSKEFKKIFIDKKWLDLDYYKKN